MGTDGVWTPPQPTVCLDLDGVLHAYRKGWQDDSLYDEPVPGARAACETLKARGFRLVVATCRTEPAAVSAWLARHRIPVDEVSSGKPVALAYVDDRAVRFDGEWFDTIGQVVELAASGPWWERGAQHGG